ncbi:MAG TPA: hypothetical protein DCZ49_01855 [Hyphomonadaceae bacterium]|nr:hypothetical protein [Hyphomonadaceae bacterium]
MAGWGVNVTPNTGPYVVAFLNRKGGVGKTSLAIALSEALVAAKKNVLVLDLDPQSSATQVMIPPNDLAKKLRTGLTLPDALWLQMRDALKSENRGNYLSKMAHLVKDRSNINLSIIPNADSLWDVEFDMRSADQVANLRAATAAFLAPFFADFDFVIVDCPPGRTITSDFIMERADLVLTPVTYDPLSIWGMEKMQDYFRKFHPDKPWYFIPNRLKGRLNDKEVDDVRKKYKAHLFTENARRASALGGSAGEGLDKVFLEINEDKNIRLRMSRLHDDAFQKKRRGDLKKLYGDQASKSLEDLARRVEDIVGKSPPRSW